MYADDMSCINSDNNVTSVYTIIGEHTPSGISRAEIKEIFMKFGPLFGEGLRFPTRKLDVRFFVDFVHLRDAYKAYKLLNGRSHPVTGRGYTFKLHLSQDAQYKLSLQNNKRKAAALALQEEPSILKPQEAVRTSSPQVTPYSTLSALKSKAATDFNVKSGCSNTPATLTTSSSKEKYSNLCGSVSQFNTEDVTIIENNRQSYRKPLQKTSSRDPSQTNTQNTKNNKVNQSDQLSKSTIETGVQVKRRTGIHRLPHKKTNTSTKNDIIDLLSIGEKNLMSDKETEELVAKMDNVKLVLAESIGAFKLVPDSKYGSFVIPVLPQLSSEGNIIIM